MQKDVALITGGSRGIGFAIAQQLGSDGYDLAIVGRRAEEEVQEPIAILKEAGADVLYCRCDISDSSEREKMLADVKAHYGRLNVLVNNAGMAPRVRADILEADESSYEEVMKVNLQGPYFLTQAVANWMVAQSSNSDFSGCVINVSSISAVAASIGRGEYCVSKAGLSMATKLYALRLAEYGIPVYEIQPGVIATDMTAGVKDKYDKLIADGLFPQARWGQPEDVAKVAASMAGGSLPYSTGAVVRVDGGFLIERL